MVKVSNFNDKVIYLIFIKRQALIEPSLQVKVAVYVPIVFSVGAKLRYMGYFASLLHPPGRKGWLPFSVRDMSGGLRNTCFTKFSVVNFL